MPSFVSVADTQQVVDVDPDADATIPANRQGGSTTLQLLQQERSMLLARWQCLLEERKQLTAAMKLLATGEEGSRLLAPFCTKKRVAVLCGVVWWGLMNLRIVCRTACISTCIGFCCCC